MEEDAALLAEMMLQAEVFCAQVEGRLKTTEATFNGEELRLKISQCRGALLRLQEFYDDEKLTITNSSVRADFRHLVMALLWVGFRGGLLVDFKLFRKLVQIESGFTYLLLRELGKSSLDKQ